MLISRALIPSCFFFKNSDEVDIKYFIDFEHIKVLEGSNNIVTVDAAKNRPHQ